MKHDATSPRPLHCPRCGYDVTSVIASRTDACPECGLAIDERNCAPRVWDGPFRRSCARFLTLCLVLGFVCATSVGALGVLAESGAAMVLGAFVVVVPVMLLVSGGADRIGARVIERTGSRAAHRVFPALAMLGLACASVGFVVVLPVMLYLVGVI